MLNLKQIKSFYQKPEAINDRHLLREYLQYLILEAVFSWRKAQKLNFMGGTSLRICYGHDRFSEDLDFDNFGITKEDFSNLAFFVKTKLEKQGFEVETKNVFKKAFRCYLRISSVLYNLGLSPLKQEKILIQIDTTKQNYPIKPKFKLINKFGVFREIRVNPRNILLSQKIGALLGRKRIKGRDIYDLIFLFSQVEPDYNYLKEKYKVINQKDLKAVLGKRLKNTSYKLLARDVEHFLIKKEKIKAVLEFSKFIDSL